MEYIHVKNLEITGEHHLEKHIIVYWNEYFDFKYVAKRIKVSKHSIIDILGKDDSFFYIIELKNRPFRTKKDMKQVNRYERDLRKIIHPDFDIKKIFVDYNHKTSEIRKIMVD